MSSVSRRSRVQAGKRPRAQRFKAGKYRANSLFSASSSPARARASRSEVEVSSSPAPLEEDGLKRPDNSSTPFGPNAQQGLQSRSPASFTTTFPQRKPNKASRFGLTGPQSRRRDSIRRSGTSQISATSTYTASEIRSLTNASGIADA